MNHLLEPQQILGAFDEHMDKFKWRLGDIQKDIEIAAYRQLISTLQYKANSLENLVDKLESVFKDMNINPREHPIWATKLENKE